jgi:hypothetical protein
VPSLPRRPQLAAISRRKVIRKGLRIFHFDTLLEIRPDKEFSFVKVYVFKFKFISTLNPFFSAFLNKAGRSHIKQGPKGVSFSNEVCGARFN